MARPAIDLRPLLPRPTVQGDRPTCLPLTATTLHEAARTLIHASAKPEPLGPEALWHHCHGAGLASTSGTYLSATADALSQQGQPPLAEWPYDSTLGAGTEPVPPSAISDPWFAADLAELPLDHDGIEDLVETAIAARFPVLLMLEVTTAFFWTGPSAEIEVPTVGSGLGEYHAVAAVGSATSPDGSVRRLLIQNSWGAGWGAGGYGWLPLRYLIAFSHEAAIIDPRALTTTSAPAAPPL